jgi:hypothetical protein
MSGRSATGRPPPTEVKCLLPVWGHGHVRQFLEYGLPTLLAPGNVPALKAALPCEFVIATASEDAAAILEHPNWQRLTEICPTRIVPIDDLISDASHATSLTLAYSRLIRAGGPAMVDCCFLFLVADFLLADGSLISVLRRLQADASGVLAGNFQVAAEEMAPHLPISGDLRPRELVRLALGHLHPDTTGSIVNGDFRHSAATNRLFWRVDDNTLLGRFYLAHMIGIRPEVTDFIVGSSCDYSFIPELCPSGNVETIADSDEYFAVEMQPPGNGAMPGAARLNPAKFAADLSKWTTARHRNNADTTIVFHAGDITSAATAVAAQADATVCEIAEALSPAPRPHRDHPYWIGGLALHRATTGRLPEAELGYRPADRQSTMTALLWRLRLAAFGRPPSVRPWHPRAADYACARKAVAGADHVLVVAGEPRSFAHWLRPMGKSVTALGPAHVLNGALSAPDGGFDACLIVLPEDAVAHGAALLAKVAPSLTQGAAITVLATGNPAEEISLFAPAGDEAARLLPQGGWSVGSFYTTAGPVRRTVQQRLTRLMRAAYGTSPAFLPFYAIAWAGLAAASYVCNLTAMRPAAEPDGWCSSVVLTVRKAGPAANHAATPVRRHSTGLVALCAIS